MRITASAVMAVVAGVVALSLFLYIIMVAGIRPVRSQEKAMTEWWNDQPPPGVLTFTGKPPMNLVLYDHVRNRHVTIDWGGDEVTVKGDLPPDEAATIFFNLFGQQMRKLQCGGLE